MTTMDRACFVEVRMAMEILTKRLGKELDRLRECFDREDLVVSDWHNLESVLTIARVSRHRVDRLVCAGWLLKRPSGGHGPEIKLNK